MLYIKINTDLYPIEKIQSFKTQAGNDAMRVVGNAPQADNGFFIVDENDKLISDKHTYTHLYREDNECKEYTAVAESIVPTEDFVTGTPVSPYTSLSKRISNISSQVNDITPYIAEQLVGIQDTSCVFKGVYKEGSVTATIKTSKGEYLPCEIGRSDDVVKLTFESLKETATATIIVQ